MLVGSLNVAALAGKCCRIGPNPGRTPPAANQRLVSSMTGLYPILFASPFTCGDEPGHTHG